MNDKIKSKIRVGKHDLHFPIGQPPSTCDYSDLNLNKYKLNQIKNQIFTYTSHILKAKWPHLASVDHTGQHRLENIPILAEVPLSNVAKSNFLSSAADFIFLALKRLA